MKIVKDNIKPEDKLDALNVMNKLKAGNRVFGNPAEGLKQTLKNLEEQEKLSKKNKDALEFLDNDGDLKRQMKLLKAGINGEETLAEYFEKIIKYDEILQDIILFASLSDPEQSQSTEYISDSDFVAIYGNHVLILDAKNITTNPESPIYLNDSVLVGMGGAEIMKLVPSVNVWRKIFRKNDNIYSSVSGCVVIVNQTGASIWKNAEWHTSNVKPLHISDLVSFLHEWVKGKSPETNLSLLTSLVKMQIKKENTGLNLRNTMKRFGV